MIRAVQHVGRANEGAQSRRKSSGPVFSVPTLPCADGTQVAASAAVGTATTPGIASGKPVGGTQATTATASANAATPSQLGKYLGRSTGSGQCVALAKAVQPSLGSTSNWRAGDKVQGNASLQPGTVIATFNKASRYANAVDGSSHAAIYLSQNAQGVQVLDQWAGNRAAIRTIPWNNSGAAAANTGSAFHVVKTG